MRVHRGLPGSGQHDRHETWAAVGHRQDEKKGIGATKVSMQFGKGARRRALGARFSQASGLRNKQRPLPMAGRQAVSCGSLGAHAGQRVRRPRAAGPAHAAGWPPCARPSCAGATGSGRARHPASLRAGPPPSSHRTTEQTGGNRAAWVSRLARKYIQRQRSSYLSTPAHPGSSQASRRRSAV